jgi:hypothetical protein
MINFDTVQRMKMRRAVVVCTYQAVGNRIDSMPWGPVEMTDVVFNKSKEGTPEAMKRELLARR